MLFMVLGMIFAMQSVKVSAQAELNSLIYEGDDYVVELRFRPEADIGNEAYLKVTEIVEGSKEYKRYFSETEEVVNEEKDAQISYARFFDVSIMAGEKEIEPDHAVTVSVTYKNGIEKEKEDGISVVHFVEDGSRELLDVKEEYEKEAVTKITFEQESFSVIGTIIFDEVNTNVKGPKSETITGTDIIRVSKEWSDGEELHKKDAVTVSLYEQGEKKSELVLSSENGWNAAFDNLDRKKEYSIQETKVVSGNQNITSTYKTTITFTGEKQWSPSEGNRLKEWGKIVLVFDDGEKKLLRKSGTYDEMNLRATKIDIVSDDFHGDYFQTAVSNNYIWNVYRNEDNNAWNLFNVEGNAYLSLLYDGKKESYYWATSRELAEGSDLQYENGKFSATVNGVTKYLGNVTAKGPYEGLNKNAKGITGFTVYTYQNFSPVTCNIYNEKNTTTKEHETNVDVITRKTIDYLGDGKDNPDTDADNGKLSQNILNDLYRLKLDVKMQTDVTGLDLLLVIDVSSSMKNYQDARDENGNLIFRAEALRQALNEFVPEFLKEGTKNRLAVVAFESESMLLQDWTDNPDDLLQQIHFESNGEMPLYNGEGTNYEAALARAHEVLAMRGYSNNAQAMLFLSDGEPTVYIEGNDQPEAGNVTHALGSASLSEKGMIGTLPDHLRIVWGMDDGKAVAAANEAITSFQKHNPEVMTGTVAFNTKVTDSLRNLATEENFVVKIQNGTPKDLIHAMELITEYSPAEITIVDELTENVELYEAYPDFKVTKDTGTGEKCLLYSSQNGLTEEGKKMFDKDCPIEVSGKKVILSFGEQFNVKNDEVYSLSFHVNASQTAFNKYADSGGTYTETGDEDTDYEGNITSSLNKGFYSNGNDTKVNYSFHGAKISKKYKKPVIQVDFRKSLLVKKVDDKGNPISGKAKFALYRRADKKDENTVMVEGISGNVVLAAKAETDKNGEITFENLRLKVFDEGYPYYLVEEQAPEGYAKLKNPVLIRLFKESVEVGDDNALVLPEKGGIIVINKEAIEIPVTGGEGTFIYYLIGIVLIIGGIMMRTKKRYSKMFMMLIAFALVFQMFGATAFAIDKTEKGSITVSGVEDGVCIHAYRLMDINYDYEAGQPENPMYKWTTQVAGWIHSNYPEYIDTNNGNAVKELFSEAKDVKVAQLYDKLAVAIKAGTIAPSEKTVIADSTTMSIGNLEMGNYFLLIEGGAKVYRPLTANVVPEWKNNAWNMTAPVVDAKATTPSITKTVSDGLKKDHAKVGDTISYELLAVVPTYPENATAKKYVISDQLSKGLTLKEDSIKVYGVNGSSEEVISESTYVKSTRRPVESAAGEVSFALDFQYDGISQYHTLKVVYQAVLNENAVLGEKGNKNTVFLDYNNNPYVGSSYATDEDETEVYSYGIRISKIDENTKEGLVGAEFILSKDGKAIEFSGKNGNYHVTQDGEKGSEKVRTGENGELKLNGLDIGDYVLKETKAPDGYVKLQHSINVEIGDDNVDGKVENGNVEYADGYVPVTVENDKGFSLPVTGGIGTTLFHIVGLSFIGCGIYMMIVLAVYKKYKRNKR